MLPEGTAEVPEPLWKGHAGMPWCFREVLRCSEWLHWIQNRVRVLKIPLAFTGVCVFINHDSGISFVQDYISPLAMTVVGRPCWCTWRGPGQRARSPAPPQPTLPQADIPIPMVYPTTPDRVRRWVPSPSPAPRQPPAPAVTP